MARRRPLPGLGIARRCGTTWLADDAIWITIIDEPLPSPLHPSPLSFEERGEGPGERGEVRALNLKLTFPGANPDVQIQPLDPLTTTVSYFLGNDPAQWRPAVPVYGGVRYVGLYPGVDLVLGQADSFWQLEAEPGAATEQVRVQVEGAAVEAVADGVLRLVAEGQPLSLALPQASFAYRASGVSPPGRGRRPGSDTRRRFTTASGARRQPARYDLWHLPGRQFLRG